MEAQGSVRFADVPAGHGFGQQQGIPAAGMMHHPSMSAFLAGLGMAPSGFFLPGRAPAPATTYGANAPQNVWNGMVMMAAQQPQAGGGGGNGGEKPPQVQKGPWTPEEDM